MVKRIVVLSLILSAAALSGVALSGMAAEGDKAAKALGAAKGEQVTLSGQFSCTFCTLAHPEKACTKDCCAKCVKAGDPPSLTEAEGNKYLLLTGEQGIALMTPARAEMLGGQVTVKGLLVKGKGLQAIYVDSLEKADAKVAITGRLACTFCTLAHADKPCTQDCCVSCWKAGDPPALIDAEGNMYVLLTGEQGVPLMTPERIALAGQQVTAKGLIVRTKGLQAIYVDSLAKAQK